MRRNSSPDSPSDSHSIFTNVNQFNFLNNLDGNNNSDYTYSQKLYAKVASTHKPNRFSASYNIHLPLSKSPNEVDTANNLPAFSKFSFLPEHYKKLYLVLIFYLNGRALTNNFFPFDSSFDTAHSLSPSNNSLFPPTSSQFNTSASVISPSLFIRLFTLRVY